jgi:tetratricopeptide (TPR) repeat protein
MDAGRWYEARRRLEQVHKTQTGFLETERLLRKVENEITRIEELERRNIYINTLYEQAHELVRSKNWRKALDKIEEIQRLDSQFEDRDKIFEKARAELDREEEIVQRQNRLAAMYTEAVRLLREGKNQEALDKWHEVSLIDPKYPDRQRVQSIARRKLTELAKPLRNKPRLTITKPIWAGILSLIAVGVVVAGMALWNRGNEQMLPSPIATSSGEPIALSATSAVATRTNMPSPSTPVAPTIVADPLMYDDFNNSEYDGNFNTALWNGSMPNGNIVQENGSLTFELNNYSGSIGIHAIESYEPTHPIFVESKVMLDPTSQENAVIYVAFGSSAGDSGCGIWAHTTGTYAQEIACATELATPQQLYSGSITPGTWHFLRIELHPDTMTFVYFVDGDRVGSFVSQNPDTLKDLRYNPLVFAASGTDSDPSVTGHADYVKIGEVEESETKETAYRWDFENGSDGWGEYNHITSVRALDGYLTFKTTGIDPSFESPTPLEIVASQTPVITIRMRIIQGQSSEGQIYFVTNRDIYWGEAKKVTFLVEKDDGNFKTYDIAMTINSHWKDVITQFRVDPTNEPGVEIAIDYISVHAP